MTVPTNPPRQESKMLDRIRKPVKLGRAMAHAHHETQNSIRSVEWNHRLASIPGLSVVPNPRRSFEECTKGLASSFAATEYAIDKAAIRLSEKSGGEVTDQNSFVVFQLRARLFDFVCRRVIYSSSSCWGSRRIRSLSDALLRHLHLPPGYQSCEKLKMKTDLGLALLFDCAVQFRAQLVQSGEFRYEIAQFKPGDIFHPDFMRIQGSKETDDTSAPSTNGPAQRIRLCIHGCLVALLEEAAGEPVQK